MTVEELKTMIGKFGNTDQLAMSGLSIGQKKYMYISSTEKVIRLKKGTSGCHIIKTGQSKFIISFLVRFSKKKKKILSFLSSEVVDSIFDIPP